MSSTKDRPVLEWIPSPKTWKVVEYSFEDLVRGISNRFGGLASGLEVEMTSRDLEYLQALYDIGHPMAGHLMTAIKDHGVIRVRMVNK